MRGRALLRLRWSIAYTLFRRNSARGLVTTNIIGFRTADVALLAFSAARPKMYTFLLTGAQGGLECIHQQSKG